MLHRVMGSLGPPLLRKVFYGCLKLTDKYGWIFSATVSPAWSLPWARLGAPRRRCGDRVLRPRVFGVTAAHFGTHGGIAAAPKTRQVARRLHRPVRRRNELDQQRHFAGGDRRMAVEAEQLL